MYKILLFIDCKNKYLVTMCILFHKRREPHAPHPFFDHFVGKSQEMVKKRGGGRWVPGANDYFFLVLEQSL